MKKTLLLTLFLTISLFTISQERIPFIDYDNISEEASKASELNDNEKVLEILNKINKNDSIYCNVLISKSYYLLNSEKYEEAIKVTDEGLNLNCYDSNLSFYINKGLAYIYLEKYDDALKIYNKGLEIYPKYYLLWHNKGVVLERLNKADEAITAYQNAITLNPIYAKSHLQLGNLCYKQELISQALMCYNVYLLLTYDEEGAFSTLKFLNNIVADKNENEANPDLKISEDDEAFEDLDLILSNKIALNKNYDTGNKINISLTKQNHALIAQIKDFEGNGGFWDKKYVPLFKWISTNNFFDNFTYTLSYSIQNEKYMKLIQQKQKDITSFMDLFYKKWYDILKTNTILLNGKEQEVTYSYRNSYVQAIGVIKDGLFIGNWEFYNSNGQLFSFGKYNNEEKKIEKWTWLYDSGKLKETAIYKNGELNGENLQFHKNGKPYVIANYVEGKLDGEYKYYNERGALIQKKYYKNGKLDGLYRSFFDVGEDLIEFNIPYKNDNVETKATEYYANGNVYAEIPFVNGKRHGTEKKYFWNKNVSTEANYIEGELNGSYKTYFSNGNPSETGQSLDNFYNGPWKSYYKDNTIEAEYSYNKGYLDGQYKFYDTDGKIYYEYLYRKGEVIEYKYYDKQGQILSEGRKKGGEFQFNGHHPSGHMSSKGLYDIKGGKEGPWEFYSSNGVLTSKGKYTDNKITGEYITYHNNGEIESKSNYKNDSLTGYYSNYYKNGQLKSQGWYKNNLLHGEWHSYYIDGTLKEINFYHKDQLHGNQKRYSCNGKIARVYKYNFGKLFSEVYFDHLGNALGDINFRPTENNFTISYHYLNKKIDTEINYVNGLKHGKHISYDFYGNKALEGNYINGNQDGKWIWYYPSGKTKTIRKYLNGNLNGESINYYENGTIKSKSLYEYGTVEGTTTHFHKNGKKSQETEFYNDKIHGKKVFYDYNENLQLVRFYNHGRLIGYSYLDKNSKELPMIPIQNETGKVKSYFDNGNVARELEYKNGDLVNTYRAYYYDGQLENEMFYKSDEYDGSNIEFYPNGKVKTKSEYQYGNLHGLTKNYYENGTIKEEINYCNNMKSGEANYYDKTGKIIKKERYFNDEVYEYETY